MTDPHHADTPHPQPTPELDREDGNLPSGWVETTLGEVAEFEMGQAPPGNASNFEGKGTPFVKAGEFGKLRPIIREWTTDPKKFAREDDVLICVVGATAGKLNLGADCAIGRSVAAIRPTPATTQLNIYHQLLVQVEQMRADSIGSAQGVISSKMLSELEILLPPLPEQIRIADKLDKLLARVEAGRERLARVPGLLARLRQSILSAAVSGELTREWRGGGEPEWEEVTLGQVARWSSGGTPSRSNPAYFGGGIPWVKTGELRESFITTSEETLTQAGLQNSSAKVFPVGTVLIAIYGATIGRVGILGIEAATNQACAAAIPLEHKLNRDYLYYFLRAEKEKLIALGQGGAQPNISQAILKSYEFSCPPLPEQSEIVRRVELLFASVDALERQYAAAAKSFDLLTPALLQKAFLGELVPQDPEDEPAAVLLERIRAQRAASGEKPKRGRGTGKAKAQAAEPGDSESAKRRGRPRKVEQASSVDEAIQKLEARKAEQEPEFQRAEGTRQVGLFDD